VTVLFVGDIGLDTTVVVSHVPSADEKVLSHDVTDAAGGVVANAARAAVLAGARARLLCAVGQDANGPLVLEQLAALDVQITAESVPGATCRAIIVVDGDGEKRLILLPGQSMYPSVEAVRSADLTDVRWVHTAAYDLAAATELAARCRAEGVPWSLDLEPATIPGSPGQLRPILDGAAAVFCNSRAAESLGGDAAAGLLAAGARRVVLTLGARGAVLVDAAGRQEVDAVPAGLPVVDTTGAGDCLAGWFAARAAAGDAIGSALAEAVVAASLSCTALGAQRSYPGRDAVLRLVPQPATASLTR
jgi:ribokinase